MGRQHGNPGMTGGRAASQCEKLAHIVSCAREVLLDEGASAFSVRKVAARAGMSLGHLQHYFPDRHSLLVALIANLRAGFWNHYQSRIEPIEDPAQRYLACAAYVIDQGPDERMFAMLREFWTLAARDARLALILANFYADCRRLASGILLVAVPGIERDEADLRAATSISMLSAAFLYLHSWSGNEPLVGFRQHLLSNLGRLALSPASG